MDMFLTKLKTIAPGEDRTHGLQISLCDYETDALPTALPRQLSYSTCVFKAGGKQLKVTHKMFPTRNATIFHRIYRSAITDRWCVTFDNG